MIMKRIAMAMASTVLFAVPVMASGHDHHDGASSELVADAFIANERKTLAKTTNEKGFGPQSPRDIDARAGNNQRAFNAAPPSTVMSLCNIHFHKNAEHKAKDFSVYAGNGDGDGYLSGYKYSGKLNKAELKPIKTAVCNAHHGKGALLSGDTIEVHYVYSTAQITPGPTLGSCLSKAINNPQLRVETQVYVLVNDKKALDFKDVTRFEKTKGGLYQALGIPSDTGAPVQYAGSTTGPGYNKKGSPFQVTWSIRPYVAKVNIATVGTWCKKNVFNEDHGHGVRNLVQNLDLLSAIK
ncbi:MAG: delta-class carbonic anhydrase [Mariprofundaceae bacterium]|nr:delta-class carbonic anhydrase [Mariprofundaceae bacterium]